MRIAPLHMLLEMTAQGLALGAPPADTATVAGAMNGRRPSCGNMRQPHDPAGLAVCREEVIEAPRPPSLRLPSSTLFSATVRCSHSPRAPWMMPMMITLYDICAIKRVNVTQSLLRTPSLSTHVNVTVLWFVS